MTETPDIIYTQQFVAANVQYLDYSEREEAVDLLNDFDLETGESNIQHDVDENLAGYLGYTDQKAATKLEDGLTGGLSNLHTRLFEFDTQTASRIS